MTRLLCWHNISSFWLSFNRKWVLMGPLYWQNKTSYRLSFDRKWLLIDFQNMKGFKLKMYCIVQKDIEHREFFSKLYWIKPNLDCIYQFPIDLKQQTESDRFQINRKMVSGHKNLWAKYVELKNKYLNLFNTGIRVQEK